MGDHAGRCEWLRLPVHSPGMALSPLFVADVLLRQGLISSGQADEIKREARQLPSRAKAPSTYEQKAVAYDLISSLRYPSLRDPKVTIGEQEIAQAIAADANVESVQIDTLALDADLIESKISRPFASFSA